MLRAAIYCRLSDEDKNKPSRADESESIQNQKTLLSRYAIEQGWDIYNIYSDDDYSGLDKDRPEFNRMLKDAEAKKFNIVLCKSQSRFTRDMELVEKYLHNKFIEWNIRFIGLADNSDTSNKGNKKQRQIIGLTNEWYCEDVSDNIRAIFNMKRHEGLFIGSFSTYGYIKDPNNKNRLIIDENAAEVVRRIYDWYMEGYGTQHIAHMLNENRIPNPTKYKQQSGLNYKNPSIKNEIGLWNKTTVKRILKNEMYVGNMVQGIRRKVSYKSKKIISTPEDEWIKVEATHEPIISKDIFEEVQKRMKNRQRSTGAGQAHVFAAKVRCADCGSTMNKVTPFRGGEKKYSYLRCKLYTASGVKKLCTSHTIRLDELQDIITEKLRREMDIIDESATAYRLQEELEISSRIKRLQKEVAVIERQLKQNSLILKEIYLDKINGNITHEQFAELNSQFSCENKGLIARKESIEDLVKKLCKDAKDTGRAAELVKKYKNFNELTHRMVNDFIEYIEIGEKNMDTGEREITIKWKL